MAKASRVWARPAGAPVRPASLASLLAGGLLASLCLYPARAQQPLASCADRLTFLGEALKAYARDHGGALPPSLETLYTAKYVPVELWAFWCPDDPFQPKTPSRLADGSSYELMATRLAPGSPEPLLREREFRHPPAHGGSAGRCRHELLPSGRVVEALREPTPSLAATEDHPPTVRLAGDLRCEWEPYDFVAYEWTGADDRTAAGKLQYQCNFSASGLSAWSATTRLELGRLRPGEHLLEVRVRDEAGQVCREPAYVRFVVRNRNAMNKMEPAERRMGRYAKSPQQPAPAARWHDDHSLLRRVDVRTTDPEEYRRTGQHEAADRGGAATAEADGGADGLFAQSDDPGRFEPHLSCAEPLAFERHFNWLHVLLYFDSQSREKPPDVAYDLQYEGRNVGGQRLPGPDADGRLLHLRLHLATGASFGVGRYRLGLSVEGKRVCDLHFNVVDPAPPDEGREGVRGVVLADLVSAADKSRRLCARPPVVAPPPVAAQPRPARPAAPRGVEAIPVSIKKTKPGS